MQRVQRLLPEPGDRTNPLPRRLPLPQFHRGRTLCRWVRVPVRILPTRPVPRGLLLRCGRSVGGDGVPLWLPLQRHRGCGVPCGDLLPHRCVHCAVSRRVFLRSRLSAAQGVHSWQILPSSVDHPGRVCDGVLLRKRDGAGALPSGVGVCGRIHRGRTLPACVLLSGQRRVGWHRVRFHVLLPLWDQRGCAVSCRELLPDPGLQRPVSTGVPVPARLPAGCCVSS